ncbi:MAG: hypothetical protein WA152_04765 [Microgenomates group bacterium]
MKKTFILLLTLFFAFYMLNVIERSFDNYSQIEIGNNFSRREYLGNELGIFYKNRVGLYYFDNVYPRLAKINSLTFAGLESRIIYVPLIVFIMYLGFKKYHEKY